MNYEFPVIRNISDVLPAIEGSPEFIVAEKDGYTVINYLVMTPETFPEVNREEYSIGGAAGRKMEEAREHRMMRRECRGIIFCSETGEIIRRPFHKFFNVNERDETKNLDLTHEHVILEKLDGSMIAPFYVQKHDKIIWGTKMGATDVAKPVEEFVKQHPNYAYYAERMLRMGFTPIFEWCSRQQRIVIDHPVDRLVLVALRDLRTGAYADYERMKLIAEQEGIEVVKAFAGMNRIQELTEYTRGLDDCEGFVVRFADGHMAKLKCDWYLTLHKTLEHLVFEKDVIRLVLNNQIDDVKAILPDDMKDRLDRFSVDLWHGLQEEIAFIKSDALLQWALSKGCRKTFAQRTEGAEGRQYWFKALDQILKWEVDHTYDWHTAFQQIVIDSVRDSCSSQSKVDAIRWLIGNVKWDDYA